MTFLPSSLVYETFLSHIIFNLIATKVTGKNKNSVWPEWSGVMIYAAVKILSLGCWRKSEKMTNL